MSETSGQNGQSRLDRIEAMFERAEKLNAERAATADKLNADRAAANEAAHDWFEAEHKRLLTAQILMNGAMQKMAEGMTSLEIKMEETTGKLNALIDTVDGIIRNKAS